MKETQPLRFFGAFAALFAAAGAILMTPVLIEYMATGLVPRMPTWMLSLALMLLSMLMGVAGLILDSVARGRAETKRILYLGVAAAKPKNSVAAETQARSKTSRAA
jgi:hypothetical protein